MSSTWRPSCCGDDDGEWTPEKIEETLATKKTVEANFVKPVPVHIVYFSVAALNDGTIVNYTDLYKRDDQVIAALLDSDGKAPGKRRPRRSRPGNSGANEKGGSRRGRPLLDSWNGSAVRLQLVGVDHPAVAEPLHHVPLVLAAEREAALAAAELAVNVDHLRLGIPGVVDDDRPGLGIVVGPVEAADLHREAVFAVIGLGRRVGAVRGRFRAGLVREMLEEAGVAGIRAAAMGDAEALDMAARQVDDMEARLARALREIDHADEIAMANPAARIERRLGLGEQCRD